MIAARRIPLRTAVLLVLACVVVYANGMRSLYTYDDKAIVRDNPRIRSPARVLQLFSTPYFGGPRGSGSNYRPLLLLSFALQWWIHGGSLLAFHAVNVALHAAATLLFLGLLVRLGIPSAVALASALLFAVHPVHVEAVTSLVGRGETQAAVLTFLYLLLALRMLRAPTFASRLKLLLPALLCFALAVLTKESASCAPALAFLLFVFVGEGPLPARFAKGLSQAMPLLLGSAGVLAGVFFLRAWVLGGILRNSDTGIFEVENPLARLSAAARMANSIVILFRYLGRILFPLHLSADESFSSIRILPALSPVAVAAVLILAAASVLAVAHLRRRSLLALGFLFFCVALLPAGNLLFANGTIFAERLAYLPSAGICLAGGSLLVGGVEIRRTALAAIVLLLASRAVVRNAVWASDEDLFFNLLLTSPSSAKAHYDYAYVSAGSKLYRRARDHYLRAIAIYPKYWDAWAGKGRMEKELGLLSEAESSYENALAANSAYENGYFGLGVVREARGDWRGAEKAYREGLARRESSLPLAYRLAIARSHLSSPSALADWRRAVAIGPDSAGVRADFAAWLLKAGKDEEAARQARQALRRDPRNTTALRVLAERGARKGWALAQGLALEKTYRISRSEEDRRALTEIARSSRAYGARFARLRIP